MGMGFLKNFGGAQKKMTRGMRWFQSMQSGKLNRIQMDNRQSDEAPSLTVNQPRLAGKS
jgi:hypothetical protein